MAPFFVSTDLIEEVFVEIKRFKDIVAFKWEQNDPFAASPNRYTAFHALNLEVADISEEAWNQLSPALFEQSAYNLNALSNEAGEEIISWNQSLNSDIKDLEIPQRIQHLTINVTQICNLGCAYCAAGGDGTYGEATTKISVEKTLPQLKYFIDKLDGKGTFNLTFLGGEPLLYPEGLRLLNNYLKLLTAGTEIQLSYNVITNGTLINPNTLAILKEMKAHITISIDGKPEVQDRVRPMKNGQSSSAAAINGLRQLLAAKSELGRILVHSVFTKEHTAVAETYLYLSEFQPDAYEFTFDVTESDEATNAAYIKEMQQTARLAWERGQEDELRKITLFDGYFKALDAQLRKSSYCGSGKSLLSIDAKNRVFACPLDIEDKNEQVGQDTRIDQSKLSSLQAPFIEANNCQDCWAKHLCGGGCLYVHKTLTGTKNKKHRSFCDRQRRLLATSIMYYQLART